VAGFTLIELLIVIAIIGIIAALLIPNLLEALSKSKQKRTMTDIRLTGSAWISWVTDQVGAAAAGQSASVINWEDLFTNQTFEDLEEMLVPSYAAFIPENDAWGNLYEYGASEDPNATIPIGVRSRGSEGLFDTDEYTPGAFIATDFVQDLVWVGGYFVRWPAGHLVE
jgi:prepilin-type N-terminal cleavage/methylation domain-containing protein